MKARDYLQMLFLPFVVGCVFFGALAFVAYWNSPTSENWTRSQFVLRVLDIRRERSLGAWFSGALFLYCGLCFGLIGWSNRGVLRPGLLWAPRCAALACCFFSADELVSIHEQIGKIFERMTRIFAGTALEGGGFGWVLVYAPIALGGMVFLGVGMGLLIRGLPWETSGRRWGALILTVSLLLIPTILLCEVVEGLLWTQRTLDPILTCFEENFELGALIGLVHCSLLIARGYDL